MMQTQWPGLGPNLDFSSLDASAGTGRQVFAGDGAARAPWPLQTTDGVARPWWTCGTGSANGGDQLGATSGLDSFGSLGTGGGLSGTGGGVGGLGGALGGIVSGLVSVLQQLAGALGNNGAGNAGTTASGYGGNGYGDSGFNGTGAGGGCRSQSPLPSGPQQRFADADVSSTGDPHLAVTGTREGRNGAAAGAVDQHWDSMSAHDDLVHSNQIEGGYRVSTAVTQPAANGVTFNQSATVHANFDQDAITMNRDGSFGIYDDGKQLQLGNGESATLSGGETVTVNQDGSLAVDATSAGGGTIATTLRSTGNGVDVGTHAHELALGGDAVAHGARGAHAPGRGGHKPRYTPVAQQAAAALQN